jgi:AcrR family transcriptional regulator
VAVATSAAVARTPNQQARRARIVAAATELLEARDYDRIQIRDVAEAAGVALDTLYRYFPSKEQLYANVLLAWSGSFGSDDRSGGTRRVTDQERLREALHLAVRAYERRPTFYRLLTILEVAKDPAVTEAYAAFAAQFGTALRRALARTHDDDAAVIATTASAVLGSLLRGWAHGRSTIADVHADIDRFVDVVFGVPRSTAG